MVLDDTVCGSALVGHTMSLYRDKNDNAIESQRTNASNN